MSIFKQKKLNFGEVLPRTRKEGSGKIREVIAKLARGLMLPIAMLPIAGFALGIGTTIHSQATSPIWLTISQVIMTAGNVAFATLPLLFAIAIAITFTNDSGTAGLSAVVGYLTFSAIQSAFLISPSGTEINYHYLFYSFSQTQTDAIFTNFLGMKILSTSIFGGMVVGGVTAYLYNKYKTIQLPKYISFFSGVRFVPIVTFGSTLLLSMIFALIWPAISMVLYYVGFGLSKTNQYGGIGSFIFGFLNRCLVPLGLHHVMNTLLWFSSVGGSFNTDDHFYVNDAMAHTLINNGYWQVLPTAISYHGTLWYDTGLTWGQLAGDTMSQNVGGDITMQIYAGRIVGHNHALNGLLINFQDLSNSYDMLHSKQTIGTLPGTHDNSILAFGQFTNFAYVWCMFGLMGAAIAMVLRAPKGETRNQAFSIVIPAAIVATLTGISEPIEFSFLFLAPILFFGFHAFMSGVAGMITSMLNFYAPSIAPHVCFSFSSGLLDYSIYGVLIDIRQGGSNCWVPLLMSIMYFPIYWFVFSWAIKKWDLPTPGRGMAKLYTKADYLKDQELKKNVATSDKKMLMHQKAMSVIEAYGGVDNIINIDACITKLRIQVKNKDLVNSNRLKELGALGVTHPSSQSVYAVFGQEADIIKTTMKEIITKGEYKEVKSNEPTITKH